jgi:nucleoid-associated protein YgaU
VRPRILLAIAFALSLGVSAAAEAEARVHTVKPGETLWTIARDRIGDGTLWIAFYMANRDQIKDPSRLYPGQELTIPEVDADPAKREALRREASALLPK